MSEQHVERFESLVGGFVCEGYGRTEGGFAYNRPGRRSIGTNGVPTYDINDLRIVDSATGEPCEVGATGEIQVRGEGVSVGYFQRPELTEAAFAEDDWMHTGDLGWLDDGGFLKFVGREDDMIKTGGENVSPSEVDAVLNEIGGVAEASVVGIADEKWGERVAAAVVRSDNDLDRETVELYCRDNLAGFKMPRTIVFVESLPKQASGKLDRNAIVALLEERSADG